ncbi:hypothetical protein J3R74_001953 [Puniceicoccus vermicola]
MGSIDMATYRDQVQTSRMKAIRLPLHFYFRFRHIQS